MTPGYALTAGHATLAIVLFIIWGVFKLFGIDI